MRRTSRVSSATASRESRYLELAGALLLRGDQVGLDVDRRIAMLSFASAASRSEYARPRAKCSTLYDRTRPRRDRDARARGRPASRSLRALRARQASRSRTVRRSKASRTSISRSSFGRGSAIGCAPRSPRTSCARSPATAATRRPRSTPCATRPMRGCAHRSSGARTTTIRSGSSRRPSGACSASSARAKGARDRGDVRPQLQHDQQPHARDLLRLRRAQPRRTRRGVRAARHSRRHQVGALRTPEESANRPLLVPRTATEPSPGGPLP